MKKFKCLLTAMLLACSTASFAQFTNGGGGGGVSSDVEAWKGLRFSYDRTFVSADDEKSMYGKDAEFELDGLNGFSVSYVQAFKVAKNAPLFIETGAGINFARWSDSEDEVDFSANFLGLTIPVNVVYGVRINEKLAIKPYTGLYLRVNLMGKAKMSSDDEYTQEFIDEYMNGGDYNLFDDKEIDKEGVLNRCQVGWQIGATLDINKFNVGIGFALDFNELAKETRTSKFAATVGYNF